MNIISIGIIVIMAVLHQQCGFADARQIEWGFYNKPEVSEPLAVSHRLIARHLLEAEDALADLEAEEDEADGNRVLNSCPAPNRDSVKTAIQEEIERLRNDPSAVASDESEAIREHRAILAAYDNLRQDRSAAARNARSSFVENVADQAKRTADEVGVQNGKEAGILNRDEVGVQNGEEASIQNGDEVGVQNEEDAGIQNGDEAAEADSQSQGESEEGDSYAEGEERANGRVKRQEEVDQNDEAEADNTAEEGADEAVNEDNEEDLESMASYQQGWVQPNVRNKRSNK